MDSDATFSCNGKVNINDWQLNNSSLFVRGEVDNVLFPQKEYPFHRTEVKLFDCMLPGSTAIFHLKHFIKCMEVKLRILNRYENYKHTLSVGTETDFFYIRTMVCEFIVYIRTYMNSIHWDYYSLKAINSDIEEEVDALCYAIKCFLGRLWLVPESTFHYTSSNLGNKCIQPEFHMYHMHIELRWLFITLIYCRTSYWQYSADNRQTEELENVFNIVINDLLYISLIIFNRIPLTDLRQKTPYNCTCIREIWLLIQVFIDDLAGRMKLKSFWDHVNCCIDTILDKRQLSDNKLVWNKNIKCSLPDCKNSELFCIWMIYHLSLLYGYSNEGLYLEHNCSRIRTNHEQIEKILKAYVCKGGKHGERDEIDEELKVIIPLLQVLFAGWWQPRIPIISLLWDCFHKRLDQPFLLQTTGPWTLSVEKKTPMDIFKQVKDRVDDNLEQMKESSFGMFLRLLGSILRKCYNQNDARHWNQIKGRIYSKFSKGKVQEFSECGLYNFISLFLTLAVTADTVNVCSVMLDLLPQLEICNSENSKKCNLVWKGKLAVLLLFNEYKLDFSNVAAPCIDMVNLISCRKDETSRSMMTSFVDVLNTVLTSSEKFDLGEHLFIGGWIDRYLLECPRNRVGILVKLLLAVFEKCNLLKASNNTLDGVTKVLEALWSYVACRVRQLVFDPILIGDHYHDIAQLAVEFTLEALRDPITAKRHKHSPMSLFQHFAASVIVKDIRITRYYLMLILQNEGAIQDLKKGIKNFDTILIQAWIKCSILGYDINKTEIKIIQDYVFQLNEIQQIFLMEHTHCEFKDVSEAILSFVMSSMKRRSILKTEQERVQYDAQWRVYFNNIDKWILLPITDETKDSETAYWIYRCIGTLILCSSPMLYVKNQSNNLLRMLINKIALPTDQTSQVYIKNLGKRIFSMMILGLENLNVRSDISLQALIRDLFENYIPLLITESNIGSSLKVSDTLLQCFKDAKCDLARLIFELLVASFFTVSSDNIMNKNSYLVTALLRNLLKAGKTYQCYITEHILSICGPSIIACYMKVHDHHPHKQHTIDFVNDIITNTYYKENSTIRDKLKNIILTTVQKYLTVNSQFTFEFMRSVSTINSEIIESMFPHVERILLDMERNRRPSAASLRYSWDQLQKHIKNIGKKLSYG